MASRKVFGRMVRQYGLLSAAAIAAALQVQSATADTFTWSHTTNTAWNTSAADWTNTSGATAWVNNQAAPHTAVFGAAGSGGTPRAITLGGYNTYYVGGITFLNSGWNILGGNSQTWFAGASNGAPIVITNAIDTTNSIGNNAVLSDDIFSATQLPSGEPISTSVTFTGAGTINLGGNSTYTGLTTIGGTITVKLANATGGAAGRIGVVGGLDFTGAGTFDMNTSSAIIGALKGVAGSTIINTHTSSNVAMLTINGVGDVAFHGVIKDSNTGGASNTGKLALTLTGGLTETFTAAQGYSGATAVGGTTTTGIGRSNAATLILDFSKSYSPETDMLYSKGLTSTSTLTLAGNGSLTLKGKDETNNSQDFTSVAFSSGFATITLQAGANDGTDGTMALNMGTFSRATGGTAKFVADMDSTITTTTTSVLNGVLTGGTGSAIAFATFGTTDWASRLTDAGVQSIGALASYDDDDFAATKNVNVTPSVTPQSGITANTLRFNSNATLPLSGVNTVNTGGILVTSNTTNVTIEGGTLRPGSSGNELSFFNYGALLALDTVLANNGTSHVTFSGSPTSTTLIQQPATYTGTTTINNTIVSLDNDVMEEKYGSLGSGALTINGGTLELNGRNNQTFGATANNGIITNAGNEKVTLTVAGASTGTNLAHAGKFIGPMDLVWNGGNTSTFAGEFIGIEKFTKDGTGTLTLNGNNTLAISGGIDVLGGTLNIGYGINSTAGAYIGNANIVGDVYIASGATLNIFPVAQSATNKDMAYTNDYALGPVPSGEDEVQRIQLAGTLNINNATLNVKRGIFLGTDAGTMGAINGNATIN
ncbi:MAG: autotransporter-associated beta strand repeat-containing protein, partial [Phycisphaerales bacterium]|nr:autotransporter-associated beta strand repeat-containing protein [Phycisphaerales bacterium]